MIEADSPYEAYVYAYPHKTAYRPLAEPTPLEAVWRDERREGLFLYVHVPFCEMRCGFCNLFTTARPHDELVVAFLEALERQATRTRDALGAARYSRFAIGGGTPTMLDTSALARVLDVAERTMGADLAAIPSSVETSPETVTADKMRLLRARGTSRVSIGVQSFVESESTGVKRPQRTSEVMGALDCIRASGIPTLNIDLMYGLPGQTPASLRTSIDAALRFAPEEIYLYPLYVRPLTTLGRHPRGWDETRLAHYRIARDLLLNAGYAQCSMRMFRAPHAPREHGPVYCVQDDGMVGLGCGARSYTRGLHYASEYAVGARGVREILEAWVARTDAEHAQVDFGFALDGDEQRRRYVALTLLAEGLDLLAYRARFGSDALADISVLSSLEERGLAVHSGARLALTPSGVERSDAIGPALFSSRVRDLMAAYAVR